MDGLVDVIEGSHVYVPAIYVINTIPTIDQARAPPKLVVERSFGCLPVGMLCC